MDSETSLLLVDDDTSIQKLCLRMLSRMQVQADVCSTGGEALKRFQDGKTYPAVLLDVNLPDASGPTLMREFLKLQPDVQIIFFTGGPATTTTHPDAFYLKKPFTPTTMKEVLIQAGVISA